MGGAPIDISKNAIAPDGSYNFRHLRKISPDMSALTGLAHFLAENLDGSCWASIHGQNSINPYQEKFVITVVSKFTVPEIWVLLKQKDEETAKKDGHVYGLNDTPAKIRNYVLPIIEPDETDNQYINRVAWEMLNLDELNDSTAYVEINNKKCGVAKL